MNFLSLFLVMLTLTPLYAVDFKFERTLSREDRTLLASTLENVKGALPPRFTDGLPSTITFGLKSFTGSRTMPDPCKETQTEHFRFGEYDRLTKSFKLNKELMTVLKQGPEGSKKIACQHMTEYQQVIATIIHELTHAYDFNTGTPSNTDAFQNIAGFKKFLFFSKKQNISPIRPMDLYEMKNPSEAFAVNMEYFLLDEEYACRRPVMFNYFKKLLSVDPFPSRPCKVNYQVMLSTQSGLIPYKIDPKRVYRIDYLLAEKGSDAASGFGHSMFRIVLCAPEYTNPYLHLTVKETPFGKKCAVDKLFHVVASFRANNEGATLNYVKGIFGGYPSILFMLSFSDIIEEYNNSQMRDLTAYPLKLNEGEKREFLERLLEEHWDYKGSYKFVTNNCAVESLKTLHGTIEERGQLENAGHLNLTPNAMLEVLVKTGLVDKKDPEITIFSAGADKLLEAYKLISNPKAQKKDLSHYVLKSTTAQRQDQLQRVLNQREILPTQESLTLAKKELLKMASFSTLEQLIFRSKTDALKKKLADFTSDEKNFKDNPELYKALAEGKDKNLEVSSVVTKGYGIPRADEIDLTIDPEGLKKEQEQLFVSSQKILDSIFPKETNEMRELAEKLKALNDEATKKRREYRRALEVYLSTSLAQLATTDEGRQLLKDSQNLGTKLLRRKLGEELLTTTEISDQRLMKLITNSQM